MKIEDIEKIVEDTWCGLMGTTTSNSYRFKKVATAICEKIDVPEIQGKYNELILAVGNKHPNETRHETALRYIQQAEQTSDQAIAGTKKLNGEPPIEDKGE